MAREAAATAADTVADGKPEVVAAILPERGGWGG